MLATRQSWQEELDIVDRTMRAISGVTDPDELVNTYYSGIGKLIPDNDYISLSRRDVPPPKYLITRSSRFKQSLNPWTQRDRLPLLSGGLLGEIIYANGPVIIDDLPARLSPDDPAYSYLEDFASLIALPQYDDGESLNATVMMFPPGRELDPSLIPILHWQAGLFGRGATNLVLRNKLAVTLSDLDHELRVVAEIQRSLLPRQLPQISGFDIATYYLTSKHAGGDYYDFLPIEGGAWGVLIADVTGHGTPAAVIMAITHALVRAQPRAQCTPPELLTYLNDELARTYTRNGSFVTAFYALLDPQTRRITYSNAGHNPPRIVRDGRILPLDESGSLPLGVERGQSYEAATATLEPADLLLFYTDGIVEAPAPARGASPRQLFGLPRLDTLLLNCGRMSAQSVIDCICGEVRAFTRKTQPADDQTLVAMRCE
jgi:sigma-B regulation protein RsbU (phosphoserine phosphatase)